MRPSGSNRDLEGLSGPSVAKCGLAMLWVLAELQG